MLEIGQLIGRYQLRHVVQISKKLGERERRVPRIRGASHGDTDSCMYRSIVQEREAEKADESGKNPEHCGTRWSSDDIMDD